MSVSARAAATRAASTAERLAEVRARLDRLERGEPSTPVDVQRARAQAESQARAVSAARQRLIIRHRSAITRHLEIAERLESSGQVQAAARQREAAQRCQDAIQRHRDMEHLMLVPPARLDDDGVGTSRANLAGEAAEVVLLKTALTALFLWSGTRSEDDLERRRAWCEEAVAMSGAPDFCGWLDTVCRVARTALPGVRGVSAVITTDGSAETMAASDPWAARLQEIELIVGEGPGAAARAGNRMVSVQDLTRERTTLAGYASAVADMDVRGVYATPVRVQDFCVGSMTFYGSLATDSMRFDPEDAVGFAAMASAAMAADVEAIRLGNHCRHDYFVVHVASGALASRLAISPMEAEDRLRAHAFSSGLGLIDAAEQVLSGALDLS